MGVENKIGGGIVVSNQLGITLRWFPQLHVIIVMQSHHLEGTWISR